MPHERLLKKLESYGITGSILGWIKDFFTGRTQRVKIGSSFSGRADVLSGIRQGSMLGPILFTLFVYDLPCEIKSTCKIFADDTKLNNSPKFHQDIQRDIETLVKWSDTWNLYSMQINVKYFI